MFHHCHRTLITMSASAPVPELARQRSSIPIPDDLSIELTSRSLPVQASLPHTDSVLPATAHDQQHGMSKEDPTIDAVEVDDNRHTAELPQIDGGTAAW